jgi:hypothetical protein
VLPDVPLGDDLKRAVRASLGMVNGLATDRIAFPLLAAAYRAVLGDTDFSLHLAGPTGVFKTEVAALSEQHFGATMDARNLPASWLSTGNAQEGIAFAAKDALLVVDDFMPTGTIHDVQRYHREADRVFRAKGNHAGRQRMRPDGSLRPEKPPRALILSTGEDTPRGQSVRARLLTLEVAPGEIDVGRLTACQKDAAAGLYAASMAAFVRGLASRYDEVRAGLPAERTTLRDQALAQGLHRRTPTIQADLALGLRYLLAFARHVQAVSAEEEAALWERGWRALAALAAEQGKHVMDEEPTRRFLDLLSETLASGRAHVSDPDGNEPDETPEAWGWRHKIVGTGDYERAEWQPQGKGIGWVDGDQLYILPDAAYAEVQKFACDQGGSFSILPRTLAKRLHEKGLLASVEKSADKVRYTVRKVFQGRRQTVLHLRLSRHGGVIGALQCANGAPANGECATKNPQKQGTSDDLAHLAHSENGTDTRASADGAHDRWSEWE